MSGQRRITLTPKLAVAAGFDAANKRMRQAGRSKWSRGDYNLACVTQARLLLKCGTPMEKLAAQDVLGAAA